MYEDAKVIYNNPHLFHRLKRAWAFWVLTNQGRLGAIGSWGLSKQRNEHPLKIQNKKESFDCRIARRISLAQIECRDALELIKLSDSQDTFFYLDPPYINTNQGHYRGYSELNFNDLLNEPEGQVFAFLLF